MFIQYPSVCVFFFTCNSVHLNTEVDRLQNIDMQLYLQFIQL